VEKTGVTLPFQAIFVCGFASARYGRLRSATRLSIPNLQKRIYTNPHRWISLSLSAGFHSRNDTFSTKQDSFLVLDFGAGHNVVDTAAYISCCDSNSSVGGTIIEMKLVSFLVDNGPRGKYDVTNIADAFVWFPRT
jgi:hypothetical protein